MTKFYIMYYVVFFLICGMYLYLKDFLEVFLLLGGSCVMTLVLGLTAWLTYRVYVYLHRLE